MTVIAVILVVLVISTISDFTTIHWHRSRENLQIKRTIILGTFLEMVTWLPLIIAIDTEATSAMSLAIASIFGSAIGTAGAMRKLVKEQESSKDN